MIDAATFNAIVTALGDQARDDIAWAESLVEPSDADNFAQEIIFVICNSGMKNTVARGIFDRVMAAIAAGNPVRTAFGHAGKARAIETVWAGREMLLREYLRTPAAAKLTFLEGIPWIGPITKYHLAKNFGFDVAKPDVHLQRLADREGCSAQDLCQRLASATGLRVATVDTVLWRACANGVINSSAGTLTLAAAPSVPAQELNPPCAPTGG